MKKVALITGSSVGLGRSIALDLAKAGINIVIHYHSHKEKAQELAEEIKKNYDVSVMVTSCDISKESEVIKMVDSIWSNFSRIDILVNNAAICNDSLFLDKDISSFEKILNVNVIGTYLCSKYVGKKMLEQGYGKIINIASTNALDTYYPASCDYDASKAGVVSLTHNMALEFAPKITVNCVCPGWMNTDMNKNLSLEQKIAEEKHILLGRFAEVEEIASVVTFLVSDKANYINDSIIRVDGGRRNG